MYVLYYGGYSRRSDVTEGTYSSVEYIIKTINIIEAFENVKKRKSGYLGHKLPLERY